MSSKLYEHHDVWRRLSDSELVRYRCFRVLPNSGYCVQNADSYYFPFDDEQEEFLGKHFLELLIEEAPDIRSGTHDTLEEAIQAFERDYE